MWPFGKRRQQAEASPPRLWPSSLWRPRGERSLEGSEAIFGAVTLLAGTVASMSVNLMLGYEIAADHPMQKLLSYRPNPRMDAYEFRQAMEACRDVSGNCYALKVRGPSGQVEALDVLDPDRVEPMRDMDTGDVWYVIRPENGGEFYVSGQEMIHCRHVCASGCSGVSPIKVLTDTLDYDDQMKTFSIEQVKGINGAVVLEIPSDVNGKRKDGIIDEFMEHYRRSNSSLLILSGGVKASTIAKSPVDAKVLDVDRITVGKVARVYSIPPSMLGDYTESSYSSQVQQQLAFLDRTVIPIVRMYESQLNLKLLTSEEYARGYRFRFNLDDLMSADPQAQAETVQMLIRSGSLTPNEARAMQGRAPLPGGERLMAARDLAPLDWLMEHPDKQA